MKWFGFTIARLHDRDGPIFMLTRTGYTGELGYEIFCDKSAALEIWDAVMSAGADLGIRPMGGEALEMIRIEAGMMAAGAEFGPDVDAFEAGLEFAIDMNKGPFIGRDALERNGRARRRQLVGLEFESRECPKHGDPVFIDRRQIGVVTSATVSPTLSKAIALSRIEIEQSEVGHRVEVGQLDGHSKRLPATICVFPFIDPKREKARA